MALGDIKFSELPSGGDAQIGDSVAGLRADVNYTFTIPGAGLRDGNGNYLFGYSTVGASAVNYVTFTNSIATNPVIVGAAGTDTNIGITITPKGTGAVVIDGLQYPTSDGVAGAMLTTNGAGVLSFASSAFPAVGATGTFIRSNGSAWVASTSTITDTFAQYDFLYASSANTVAGLTTVASAALTTDGSGAPSWRAMTNGQLLIGSTGAQPVAATLTAGSGTTISNGAGSITISATGGGYGWTEITGTSQAMAVNNGYIANNAGLVTLTLPATAVVGDTITVAGKGAGGWRIAQNAGQTIHFGGSATTTGAGGYLEYTQQYDSIELLCITANTDWTVLTAPQGALTVN